MQRRRRASFKEEKSLDVDVPAAVLLRHRCEERRGLLRRNRKAVAAQQGDKGNEDPGGLWKGKLVAHAAASAISASSRGEI